METELGRDYLGNLIIGGASIKSFDIMPNTFSDMIEMNNTNSVSVRLFNVVRHINPRNERVELSVKNNHKDDTYLLVFGGWIPCSFIKNNTLLLADRNVVSEITSRYKNGKKKKNTPDDAFDSIFLTNKVTLDITTFVLEGNKQKIPDNSMIDEQVASVKKSLRTALPYLNIAEYSQGNSYYYAFRDACVEAMEKRIAFLHKAAPKLNRQFSEKSRTEAVKLIFSFAEECVLKKNDIAVLLATLRVLMVGKKNAAQLVLKDSQVYSYADSYNTVCDLTAIEVLLNAHRYHVGKNSSYNIALITKDKGLSLFSSLLSNPNITRAEEGRLKISTSITTDIFDNDPVSIKVLEDLFLG
ncbi:hypothetical protein [Aeromonas salmonicida]|uniref:hypothetical protein n=1 Tax=Aeromonas salmonicida TaxID=645 RepID=UPI0031FC35B9